MTDTQAMLGAAAGAALLLALFAGWRDRRRARRTRPDSVGLIDWPMVQVFAFIALAILGLLALHR